MPIAIRELAEMFLQDPAKVEVSPVSSTAENVEQRVYFVEKTEKRNLLYHLNKKRRFIKRIGFFKNQTWS